MYVTFSLQYEFHDGDLTDEQMEKMFQYEIRAEKDLNVAVLGHHLTREGAANKATTVIQKVNQIFGWLQDKELKPAVSTLDTVSNFHLITSMF